MARKKLYYQDLMKATEKILLEQGYGGFNFSILAQTIGIGRSTLYEYYSAKDDLIADYMKNVMDHFNADLQVVAGHQDSKEQLQKLIQLMLKYSQIHNIIKILPLLENRSETVIQVKEQFRQDHLDILQYVRDIIEKGKRESIIRSEIPTDILSMFFFNTINDSGFLPIEEEVWADWIWNILSKGIEPRTEKI